MRQFSKRNPILYFSVKFFVKRIKWRRLKIFLGFEGAFTVETHGHSGGLALFWRTTSEISLSSYSKYHIDVIVTVQGWQTFRLTGFYGELDRVKRRSTWDLIRHLYHVPQISWCLIGYINNILSHDDNRGGQQYPNWLLQGFKQVVEDCRLIDLPLNGYPYTWERGHGTAEWTESRLHRALVSKSFINYFQNSNLATPRSLDFWSYSHLTWTGNYQYYHYYQTFHVRQCMAREPMCQKIVEESWRLNVVCSLQEKVAICSEILQV